MEGNVDERDLRVPGDAGVKSIWELEMVPCHTSTIATHHIIHAMSHG